MLVRRRKSGVGDCARTSDSICVCSSWATDSDFRRTNEAVRSVGFGEVDGVFDSSKTSLCPTVESEFRRMNDMVRSCWARGDPEVSGSSPSNTSDSLISARVERSRMVSTAESSLVSTECVTVGVGGSAGDPGILGAGGSSVGAGGGANEDLGVDLGASTSCSNASSVRSSRGDWNADAENNKAEADGGAEVVESLAWRADAELWIIGAVLAEGSPMVKVVNLRDAGSLRPDRTILGDGPGDGVRLLESMLSAASGLPGRLLFALLELESPPMVLIVIFSSCLRKLLKVRMSGVTGATACEGTKADKSCCSVVLLPLVLPSSPESCPPGDGGLLMGSFTWKISLRRTKMPWFGGHWKYRSFSHTPSLSPLASSSAMPYHSPVSLAIRPT